MRDNFLLQCAVLALVMFLLGFALTACEDADAQIVPQEITVGAQACGVVLQTRGERVTECAFGGSICYVYYASTGSSIVCDFGGRPAEEEE